MKKFLQLIIISIVTLFFNTVQIFSQESGWQEEGLVRYQKYKTDTIQSQGLTADGDTLVTFHKDGMLYFWDVKTGKLLKQKQIPSKMRISADFKTYYNFIDSTRNIVDLEVFDLFTDIVIHKSRILNLAYSSGLSRSFVKMDYDYESKRFYLISSIYYFWARTIAQYNETYIFKLEKDTAIQIDTKIKLGPDFIFDKNLKKMAFTYYSSSSQTHYNTHDENFYFGILEKIQNSVVTISKSSSSSNYPPLIQYSNPRFLNSDNRVSAFESRTLNIWDINPVKLIEKHTPIKGYGWLKDYLFIKDDNFLAYSYDKIYLYDMNSKRVIDSSAVIDTNKSTYMRYSQSNDVLCFFNKDKFGIVNFKLLNTVFDLQISVDSTHVYTGQPYKVYLYGITKDSQVKWETSDGQTSNQRYPEFKFDKIGYISFTATVTDNGKEYKKTFENVVKVIPMLIADFDADVKFGSAPLTVNFQNYSKGNIIAYEWNFGNGFTSIEKETSTVYDKAGRYHVTLKATDSLNNTTTVKTFFIQVDVPIVYPLLPTKTNYLVSSQYTYDSKQYNWNLISVGSVVHNSLTYTAYFEWSNYAGVQAQLAYFDKDLNLNYKIINEPGSRSTKADMLEFNDFFLYSQPSKDLYIYICNYENPNKNVSYSLPSSYKLIKFSESKILISSVFSKTKYKLKMYNTSFFNICDGDTLNGLSIDIYHKSENQLIVYNHDNLEGKNYFYDLLDTNLKYINRVYINNPDSLTINSFAYLPNGIHAFSGMLKGDSIAVTGMISDNGDILWSKSFSNWKYFNKIIMGKKSFYLLGSNIESCPGFIEIDYYNKNFRDYRYQDNKVEFTTDIDIIDSNNVLLTYCRNNVYHCLIKAMFEPLFIVTPPDTTKTDTTKVDTIVNGIKSINPNPAHTEVTIQFTHELNIQELQIYDIDGTLVDKKILSGIKSSEITHNIEKLSIGVYFIKILSDTGTLKGKFVKY
jgi:PKD repeat protein